MYRRLRHVVTDRIIYYLGLRSSPSLASSIGVTLTTLLIACAWESGGGGGGASSGGCDCCGFGGMRRGLPCSPPPPQPATTAATAAARRHHHGRQPAGANGALSQPEIVKWLFSSFFLSFRYFILSSIFLLLLTHVNCKQDTDTHW